MAYFEVTELCETLLASVEFACKGLFASVNDSMSTKIAWLAETFATYFAGKASFATVTIHMRLRRFLVSMKFDRREAKENSYL